MIEQDKMAELGISDGEMLVSFKDADINIEEVERMLKRVSCGEYLVEVESQGWATPVEAEKQ